MMISYKIHDILIEELFEQTDAAIKRGSKDAEEVATGFNKNLAKTIYKDIFGKRARIMLLI